MEAKDVISAALSCIALIVSLVTFALNYRHGVRNALLARRPVLVFEYDRAVGWILRNVGSGPALNVVVAQKHVGGDWFNPVRIPPLSRDGRFVLTWLSHVNDTGFGVTCTDAENVSYTSTCGNDLSRVCAGALFGPWQEHDVGRHWDQPSCPA